MFKPILFLHIAAGSVALASMWIPMLSRKGGSLHRRAGWVFVVAMATVAVSAVLLALWRLLFDPRPEAQSFGVFLLYIAVLTGAAVSAGVRVLRAKKRTGAHRHWWDLGLPALLVASSVGMATFGFWNAQPIFAAFSLIGFVNGVTNLRYWLRPPTSTLHWWFAHMNGMLGGCIAAVTAFVVVNASSLGLAPIVAWLSPSVIGGIGTAVWTRYYQRRFAPAAAPAGAAGRGPIVHTA
ncbi:MAG: DUF2306 domain-containing protein [Vicinamibacterales bacterium]